MWYRLRQLQHPRALPFRDASTPPHPHSPASEDEGGEGAQLGTGGVMGRLLSLPYLARRSGGGVGEADVGHEDIRQRARGCRLGIEEW
jgi:hypothetical protein